MSKSLEPCVRVHASRTKGKHFTVLEARFE
jgi:hypothetical protein